MSNLFAFIFISASDPTKNDAKVIGTGPLYSATMIPIDLNRRITLQDGLYWLRRVRLDNDDPWIDTKIEELESALTTCS